MTCTTCGAAVPEGLPDSICPRCSFGKALGLAPAPAGAAPGLEGYELLHELGRGAMGVVWLARERSLSRLVALKLIATGADPVLAQRLLREGKAAAGLRHPHIVAVHALGGVGPSTFRAMDFLEGGNLDERLKGKPLAPAEAGLLAGKLADALAHAHAAGVLHRDLKPSNVLLDAAGEPCIADFGLATAVEGAGDLSIVGQVAGTPSYLAPELLDGKQRASAQSDLYGLGAILYFCLTGRPPFTGSSAAAVLAQVAKDEPVAPRALEPDLPRDLETICLKCLEKVPAKRYASAADLRADLDRFRRGLPLAARPVGRVEKSFRWARREPGTAAAVALGALVLALLAVGLPLQLARLARARDAAEASRARAATEAATSEAIADFLQTDLLAQASPDVEPERDLKLRTVLDRASRKIDGRFSRQPLVEAALRETLAATYESIGDYPTARHHLERAADLRLRVSGPEDRAALRAQARLAYVIFDEGKYPEAERLASAALAAQRRVDGPEARDTLSSLAILADIYHEEGRLPEAQALLSGALEAQRRVLGAEDPSTINSLHELAVIDDDAGDYAAAVRLNQETLALQRKKGMAPDNPQLLLTMNNLAHSYSRQGKMAEAEQIDRQALAAVVAGQGLESPSGWFTMDNLAFVVRMQGRLAEAEPLYLQTVEIGRKVFGPEHPNTLFALWGLSSLYAEEGKLAEATALCRQTFEVRRRTLGPSHPETLDSEDSLGSVLTKDGNLSAAEPYLTECLQLRERTNPNGWATDHTRVLLARVLLRGERFGDAEPLLLKAYADLSAHPNSIPSTSRYLIPEARRSLAQVYASLGHKDKAAEWQRLATADAVESTTR